jgi:hypothetical protein
MIISQQRKTGKKMAIDWQGLENKISKFLRDGAKEGNNSRTADETASFIAESYVDAVKSGGKEIWGNGVASIQSAPLKASLLAAFNSDFQSKSGGASALNSSGTSGVVGDWAGGVMQTLNAPPTGKVPVSNLVLSPGSPFPMNIQNSESESNVSLAIEIVKSLKQHSTTISGLNLWADPKSNPVPGPWTGIS